MGQSGVVQETPEAIKSQSVSPGAHQKIPKSDLSQSQKIRILSSGVRLVASEGQRPMI